MNKQDKIEKFTEVLKPFLPQESRTYVSGYLVEKVVHFTITKKRKTKLGDYRQPYDGKPHRISVNGSLNQYAFLITTLHELAHLTTFEKYGNKVKPHGAEWKTEFKSIFTPLLDAGFLPEDITLALNNYLANARAASCSDDRLYRVLKRYDKFQGDLVEHLSFGEEFKLNGKVFVKGKKLRKRYECKEISTQKLYRVLGVAEIEKVQKNEG